jgi:hypothetical protein
MVEAKKYIISIVCYLLYILSPSGNRVRRETGGRGTLEGWEGITTKNRIVYQVFLYVVVDTSTSIDL